MISILELAPSIQAHYYAIKTPEGYLADQGSAICYQEKPDGWALYLTREYAELAATMHGVKSYEVEEVSA